MTYEELKQESEKLIKPCTIISFSAQPWDEASNTVSNSMGNPYFKEGEEWPLSPITNKPMHFVFQIFNSRETPLPPEVELVQLFVDLENIPFSNDDPGLLIKTYASAPLEKAVSLSTPATRVGEMAVMAFTENVNCLPSWDDVPGSLRRDIIKLEIQGDNDEVYNDIGYDLKADDAMKSKIGGYPGWYQSAEKTAADYTFLFDINRGLKWCWMGAVYFFWDAKDKRVVYYHQST